MKQGREPGTEGEKPTPFVETHKVGHPALPPAVDDELEDTDSGDTTNFMHTVGEEDEPRASSLIVIRGHLFGKKLEVPGGGLIIGRDESCDVMVGSARDGTSRRHARVFFEGDNMMVEDLGSTNGLLINRLQSRRSLLIPSDLLQVGKTVFKVVGDGYEGHYHETMYNKAVRDNLTGLLNRTNLHGMLEQEIRRSQRYEHPLSLLLLDLDHFKAVNDNHGHLAGDAVLVQISCLLKGCLRQCDSLYRYGGEEFLAILPETELEGAVALAERIRASIAETVFTYRDQELSLTISIGMTTLRGEVSVAGLIQQADDALYDAKRDGRNKVVVAPRLYDDDDDTA